MILIVKSKSVNFFAVKMKWYILVCQIVYISLFQISVAYIITHLILEYSNKVISRFIKLITNKDQIFNNCMQYMLNYFSSDEIK